MNKQLALSVRAIPVGAFAASAIVGILLKDWPIAAWTTLQALLFAVWPARMAFAYRAVARWSRLTSEDLGLTRIATRDVRHFTAVRLRDGRAFELVVRLTDPDRS